jgi:NADPH:quinone reductase-like Zn-dependent oxidoreductase
MDTSPDVMRAFRLSGYGSADRLELEKVARPEPKADEVLVRVRASSVNPYDWHTMRGEPRIARLMPGGLGLFKPNLSILGADMAGEVEAIGADVSGFAAGDGVFALLEQGGFGEYVSVPSRLLVRIPEGLSYEQAAAVPMAGITALVGLRDAGRLVAGQNVLITGASGGIGTFAVQLAVALGATVTGVCSTGNAELVRSLGADAVLDYTSSDFTRAGSRYDLILDCAGPRSASAMLRALTPHGTLAMVGGPAGRWVQPAGHVMAGAALSRFVSQRIVVVDTLSADAAGTLRDLVEFIERGHVVPVIDRQFPFEQIPDAVRYQERGHARGKVVITHPVAR